MFQAGGVCGGIGNEPSLVEAEAAGFFEMRDGKLIHVPDVALTVDKEGSDGHGVEGGFGEYTGYGTGCESISGAAVRFEGGG